MKTGNIQESSNVIYSLTLGQPEQASPNSAALNAIENSGNCFSALGHYLFDKARAISYTRSLGVEDNTNISLWDRAMSYVFDLIHHVFGGPNPEEQQRLSLLLIH